MKEKSRIDLGEDQDVYNESQDLIEDEEKEAAKTVSVYRLQPSAEDHDDGSSEVTGDFDENGNLANTSLIRCLQGPDNDGNGVDSEKNISNDRKDQHNKQEQKREYATFKYSSRFRGALHEAVLVNGEPIFLKYANNHLETVRKIEEINRILRPPCIEEYPYEPIEFSSLEEITRYERMALNETIETLYQKIKTAVSLYVDQDEEVIILISADILWTYFQDLFPTTHYYDVTGRANGIGKSTIGYIFEGIAYRAVRMTDPSAANLYRILGKIETGQCIIIADEADRIHEDKEMLGILKEGYAILGKVPKINMNTGKQEFFYCYCFKIRIAEESLRSNIARGVIDRSFLIKATKGKPPHDIKEVLQPANRNDRLERLHNDLRSLRKLLLIYRLIHFEDPIVDIDVGLDGRDKELCKPLLQLFYGTRFYDEIKSTLQIFLHRKNKRKKNSSIEPVLYEIVVNLVSERGTTISAADLWNAIIEKIRGVYDGEKKPNEYQTFDYDTIYRSTITKIVCDNFGAEREHREHGNVLIFDLEKLAKAGRVYDIDNISFQAKLGFDEKDGNANFQPEGTEGTEGNITRIKNPQNFLDNETMEKNEKNDEISNEMSVDQKNSEITDNAQVSSPMALPSAPSAPSAQQPMKEFTYPCVYCSISKVGSSTSFNTSDLLERHVIKKHSGWTAYPGSADIQKFEQEKKKQQQEKKVEPT